jgi:DNA-directed RNA polymerase specialized sigma subunit
MKTITSKTEQTEEIIKKVVTELKREGMVKDKRMTTFQKTEQLLYRYNEFKEAIKIKEEQIEELDCYGLRKQSKSITRYGSGSGEVKTEGEKLEEKIHNIEIAIEDTKQYIKIIDDALKTLKNDRFYEIIPMKYFEGMSHEEIGFEFEVDTATITRNKNRLVKRLSIQFFPDEVLNEMFT